MLDRALAAMAAQDIDVMILGREANARLVADTNRLWLAGTRVFSPSCVVVRETGAVHLLANTDDAVPATFPRERLYGITWNAEKLFAALAAIPGVGQARRAAVDGMSPAMHALTSRLMPDAQLVDASGVITELWRANDDARIAGVRAATDVARAGLAAMAAELHAGVRPRTLRGACAVAFAEHGVTTPAFDAIATPLGGLSTWMAPERALAAGERVVLRAGALRDGWEGSIARTYLVGAHDATEQPAPARLAGLVAACRPGVAAGALRNEGVVYGLGRGVEPWDDDFEIPVGATCALEASDADAVHANVFIVNAAGAEPC